MKPYRRVAGPLILSLILKLTLIQIPIRTLGFLTLSFPAWNDWRGGGVEECLWEKEEEETQPERPGGASVVSGSPGHDPSTCQAVSHNIILCGILLEVCLSWQLVNSLEGNCPLHSFWFGGV